jgi:hypothetical protein
MARYEQICKLVNEEINEIVEEVFFEDEVEVI